MATPLEALLASRYLSLATFRRDGTPVATPVWFAEDSGALYVFTNGATGKVKRLRRDARARIARCTMGGRLTGPWLDTEARIVDEPAESARAYRALRGRYGLSMRIADLCSTVVGRMGAREIVRIGIPPDVEGGPPRP